jgi:hypothetical protein
LYQAGKTPMTKKNTSHPLFEPCCLATTIGSLPHTDITIATELVFESTPEIPAWAQFPKRSFHENMMVQFTEGMPGLVEDGNQIYFDTTASDFTEKMTRFFTNYLAVTDDRNFSALDHFAISARYAAGFSEFISRLRKKTVTQVALKGQVTGPFTLGVNLLDQDERCAYYDEQLRDVIVKTVALKAMWQITQLSSFGHQIIILIDEPSLLNFGSQMFLTVSREDIIRDLNEVAAAIHARGGLAGVHCEANTDWSLLMDTDLDILVFDAYDHMQAITLYPGHLTTFLEGGGGLGWGIVPTLDRDAAATETLESLMALFDAKLAQLVNKGFDEKLLLRRALITPSCGTGGALTVPLAERVLYLLNQLSTSLRSRHGFASSEKK